jgi:dipeptidase E
MRLYLSSYRLGDTPGDLVNLMRGGTRALIVANALDAIPAERREAYRATVYDPVAEFARLGIEAQVLDLRETRTPAALRDRLESCDLVWVMGGNSFVLRRAMRASGFDAVIAELLAADALVYGGFSAGAVAATPTLRGIELMDDPYGVPDGYDPEIVWDGLNLVDFSIVPHFESDHPESRLAKATALRLERLGLAHRTLRDGEAIMVEGEDLRLLGGSNDEAA